MAKTICAHVLSPLYASAHFMTTDGPLGREMLLVSPNFQMRTQTQKFISLPKSTQLVSGGAGI